jgi:hypothetical protein
VYVEDVFSTYLYTGDGATQTITNNIDLSTKGGLVWIKSRTTGFNHTLVDTVRGATNLLVSNTTAAQATQANSLTAFTSTGFSIGAGSIVNYATDAFVSWTFRKQKKFFDVVTYTGNGSSQNISHNLGSVPGCIIVKRYVGAAASWLVYHRSASVSPENSILQLNLTDAVITSATPWNATQPTDTVFSVGNNPSTNNASDSYVAYLFAHDAGGFGLAGTDNVISCGSFTTDGSGNATASLGYEPQWIMKKETGVADNWQIYDIMRGLPGTGTGSTAFRLVPNDATTETPSGDFKITATGFVASLNATRTYIYIAIRRGPMKVPTDATKVFLPTAFTSNNSSSQVISVGFPSDMALVRERTTTANYASNWPIGSRLTGNGFLRTTLTNAEVTFLNMVNGWDDQNSIDLAGIIVGNGNNPEILYNFQRASGFFDVVCYTGTGVATTQAHNLGVAPEIIIVKKRSGATYWPVRYSSAASSGYGMYLNDTGVEQNTVAVWTTTAPTSAVFSIGASGDSNASAATYVAYLFATCAGVSKVGTYTGNGSSQTIACGFSAGSRFVLIKRTDSTGDWYVWDSARGIVAGNDPHLSLNDTAAEVTTDDSVDTDNSGFIVNQLSATNVNVSSAQYLFLAIS